MGVENSYVLVLNSGWLPIGVKRLKEAISAVYENKDWQLVQIDYIDDEPLIQPVGWNDWMYLDVPEYCKGIHTIRGIIRQPTVIISKTYSKVNFCKLRPNKRGIYDRDRGVCQYTGKKLTRSNCSIDHIVPKSRGGKDTWENMVLCDKEVNNKKGSKLPDEFYLQVIKEPKSPGPLPMVEIITTKHRDWEYFIA
jgi:5-methylcytosine-specific restriction endonuclease McrA